MSKSKYELTQISGAPLRRRTFIGGAVATGAVVATSSLWSLGSARDTHGSRREQMFDDNWLFHRGDLRGAERVEFDDALWRKLDLPHDWSIEDVPGNPAEPGNWVAPVALWNSHPRPDPKPDQFIEPRKPNPGDSDAPLKVGLFDAEASPGGYSTGWTIGGTGWYRKRFRGGDVSEGDQVELRFDGSYCETEVWLNGSLRGRNNNGYTGFAIDLTPSWRRDGDNVLAVRVRNEGYTSRWYSGSGIYRHAWLSVTGPVRVPLWGISVVTPSVTSGEARVHVAVEVENRGAAAQPVIVRVAIFEPGGKAVAGGERPISLVAHGVGKAEVTLGLKAPALWSPNHSPLYRAEATVVTDDRPVDRVSTRFGVRKVEIDAARGLRINGEAFKLKGACGHHDNGLLGAVAIDRAEIRKVELLKANGYNAIRCSHNLYSPLFLDTCDELGMLVIDEAFDAWEEHKVPDDYAKHFKEGWRSVVTTMVRRDRNHPSVIMWSLGNEIPEKNTPRGVEMAKMLRDEVLRLDPTRAITAAVESTSGAEGEPARRHLDVAGYNYLASTYEADHAAYPKVVMYGSEQFARDIYLAWSKVERYPYVIGDFIWTGIDYMGETGAGSSQLRSVSDKIPKPPIKIFLWDYPAFRAGCGEIDFIGLKKPQSHYRDVLWRRSDLELFVQRPVPAGKVVEMDDWSWHDELASWTWPNGQAQPMTVRVYTRADEVRLLLNGREVGKKALTPADKLTAEFAVPYQAGELTAIASVRGAQIAKKSLVTVGAPARIQLRSDRKRITHSRNDLAYVYAEVLDAQGRIVPDAAVSLEFTLHGNGELAAVGAANPRALESFRDHRCRTFHGVALAIVRPFGQAGSVVLHAQSPDLGATDLTIEMA